MIIMANPKYILEKIKLEGTLKDLLVKSDGENVAVTYNGKDTTLAGALADIFTSVSALPTGSDVDGKISAAIGDLVNGAPETGDTLKELFDLISTNKSAMDVLNEAIGKKASADDLTAAVARIAALETKKVAESDLDTALAEKVNAAAQGNHSHSNKTVLDGITAEKVSAWDGVRGVRYGAEPPADMQDGELFVRVVSGA